jgi:outer membrane murein-binding lipoprotein Lpp
MTRMILCLGALALVFVAGCTGDAKKDVNSGRDKPVPEEKKEKK